MAQVTKMSANLSQDMTFNYQSQRGYRTVSFWINLYIFPQSDESFTGNVIICLCFQQSIYILSYVDDVGRWTIQLLWLSWVI